MQKATLGLIAFAIIVIAFVFVLTNQAGEKTNSSHPISTSTSTSATSSSKEVVATSSKPITSSQVIVRGTVSLGPTCPVERIPPEPQCAPKPYQTTIHIQPANPSAPYQTVQSDASGKFSVSLAPGTYTFAPVGGNSMPPTCRPQQVVVTKGMQPVSLDCDTGIR